MHILGIETSCDETSVAVLSKDATVLSNVVHSQIADHAPFGGVVPEVAARQHVALLPAIATRAVDEAGLQWADVDAIAVTTGPGLASSLVVGLSAAKALALRLGKPLLPINHLEGHVCSLFLGADAPNAATDCPILLLLVTGGHTCLIGVQALGSYQMLGRTLDDAAGEALDKGAKLLGLEYPGGPAIERVAATGDPAFMSFPTGNLSVKSLPKGCELNPDYCFSFSGMKTSLLYHLRNHPAQKAESLPDLAASYQQAVFQALIQRIDRALATGAWRGLGCVGGVARNRTLRGLLDRVAGERNIPLYLAEPAYCTDNAAMIAAVACLVAGRDQPPAAPYAEDVVPGLALGSDGW